MHFLFQSFSQLPHKSSINLKMFHPPFVIILNHKELRVPNSWSSLNLITKFLTQQQFINIREPITMQNHGINHCFKHEVQFISVLTSKWNDCIPCKKSNKLDPNSLWKWVGINKSCAYITNCKNNTSIMIYNGLILLSKD